MLVLLAGDGFQRYRMPEAGHSNEPLRRAPVAAAGDLIAPVAKSQRRAAITVAVAAEITVLAAMVTSAVVTIVALPVVTPVALPKLILIRRAS